jgi:hypothetical protein
VTGATALALADPEPRLGRRAAAWLCLLGPFFFASYGAANWLAAQRTHVGWVVFDWEHSIPFVPWTIVPYWSIDGFYALSLFVCTSKTELDTHAKRLLTVQIGAVVFHAVPAALQLCPARDERARRISVRGADQL